MSASWQTAVGPSTFFLTLLMAIGLVFFLRASTKDRLEQARLISAAPEAQVRDRLRDYFRDRAYRLVSLENDEARFEGKVAASLGLAIFLSGLAAVGLLSLGLVLSLALPGVGAWPLGLALLAPAAGWFYSTQSTRLEEVRLRVRTLEGSGPPSSPVGEAASPQRLEILVTGHRDELAALRQSLSLLELSEEED